MLNLTYQLLRLFSEGILPATTLQILSAAAKADGWGEGDDLSERLANLGNKGLRPQNILRDLTRLIEREGLLDSSPEPYRVVVPGPGSRPPDHIVPRTVSVVLPHEWLHKMVTKDGLEPYTCDDQLYAADVGVGRVLRDWGDRVQRDPRRVVPVGIHSDGVSYSASVRVGQSKSAIVGAWNCIGATAASVRGKRQLFSPLVRTHCVIAAAKASIQ